MLVYGHRTPLSKHTFVTQKRVARTAACLRHKKRTIERRTETPTFIFSWYTPYKYLKHLMNISLAVPGFSIILLIRRTAGRPKFFLAIVPVVKGFFFL